MAWKFAHEASSSSYSLNSTSTSSSDWKYDVFLSFRGEDIRNNFAAHLYKELNTKGIHTFKDDPKLEKGKSISEELPTAIGKSRFAVVVISEDYGSSSWCLEELVRIMECRETKGQIVIPIFYNVDPADVRKQKGKFEMQEGKFKEKLHKLDRWRKALTEVATISGWDSRQRDEAKLIEQIVRDISDNFVCKSSSDARDLVGIRSHVKEMDMLMDLNSKAVKMIAIWGMGGIGKTTVAKVIYHRLSSQFEGHCFLADVKDKFRRHARSALQLELVSSIIREQNLCLWPLNSDSNVVEQRLCHKKVLVVLDDVDSVDQLEILAKERDWFGSGSRIIITTRDKHLLEAHGVDAIYEASFLRDGEALQLFSQHAFKRKEPNISYLVLSREFVSYAKGLPLALKVLGSFLKGRSMDQWKSELNKLQKFPNSDVQNVLKISYDGLEEMEKDVFLDIACFFNGEHKDIVRDILDGCGFFMDRTFGVLLDKAMISVSDNIVSMHGLLQEMGCEIVRQESKILGERSRLWDPEDVHRVLTTNSGTEKVEGIFLDLSERGQILMRLDDQAFTRMHNLRLLKFYNFEGTGSVQLVNGGLKSLSDQLRCFHWPAYSSKSLPANFCAKNLVELSLPHSGIQQLWEGKQNLVKLRWIDLSHSQLTRTPDLSEARNLKHLNLQGCRNLVDVLSVEHITSLEHLDVADCSNLENLPGLPRNIKYLYLAGTAIEVLPPSLGGLSSLAKLDLRDCNRLKNLPSSILELRSLEILDICDSFFLMKRAATGATPYLTNDANWWARALCNASLKTLSFLDVEPPRWLILMKLVTESRRMEATIPRTETTTLSGWPLRTEATMLSGRPPKYLSFSHREMEQLPSSIVDDVDIVELDLSNCSRLKNLPSDIHRLRNLKILNVAGCTELVRLLTGN